MNEDPSSAISSAEKEEVDSRSIHVGNVRLPLLISYIFLFIYVLYLFGRMFILFLASMQFGGWLLFVNC